MAISELPLPALFEGRRFVIPRYQRHYAWEAAQCQALIDDLDMIDITRQNHIRFMGYITTISVLSEPLKTYLDSSLYERQVIDGQQRLITITLLLASIIKREENENRARDLRSKYLVTEMKDGKTLPRLLLQELPGFAEEYENGPVRELFLDLISNNTNKKSNAKRVNIPAMTRMRNASILFDAHVAKLDKEKRSDLLTKLQSHTVFGLNEATSLANAEDIFEGLNNRGKPLSDLERIKSHAAYTATSFIRRDNPVVIESSNYSREEFIEFTNQQIGLTYHSLDQRGLGKPSIEVDLILAHYPIIRDEISKLNISTDNASVNNNATIDFERGKPSEYFLNAINLKTAKSNGKQDAALVGCHKYLKSLAITTPFYADIRTPTHSDSFKDFKSKDTRDKIVFLSDSLHHLHKSVHYAPILLACRTIEPNQPDNYLKLVKAIEVLSFWTVGLQRGEIGKPTVEEHAEDIVTRKKTINDVVNKCNRRAAETILKVAEKQTKLTNTRTLTLSTGNTVSLHESINWLINDNALKKNIEGLMLFEFANRSRKVFTSRSEVINSYTSRDKLFFSRIKAPERGGRPVQAGIEKTPTMDRHAWAKHPSNIIPAVTNEQIDLVRQLNNEYLENKRIAYQWQPARLKDAGVDQSLLPDGITEKFANDLVRGFNDFVIERWAPDISGQTDGIDDDDD